MKLIAHRGASLESPENSLESLIYAAQLGADAVECDVRPTADGVYVIFHDDNLIRLAGLDRKVGELTYNEMKAALAGADRNLLTLEELLKDYKERTPILLHIKMNNPDDDFVNIVRRAPVEIICGVQSIQALKTMSKVFPSDHILAFMPAKECYPDFAENKAGIIRLWEHWLQDITPADVKEKYDVEVWIMAYKNGSLDGCVESLSLAYSLGADGMLLNNIVLGLEWRKQLELLKDRND